MIYYFTQTERTTNRPKGRIMNDILKNMEYENISEQLAKLDQDMTETEREIAQAIADINREIKIKLAIVFVAGVAVSTLVCTIVRIF